MKHHLVLAALLLSGFSSGAAQSSDVDGSTEELTKAAQNPVASLISVPFQNSSNFSAGPYGRVQNVLLVQPVIPMELNENWNLITRVIMPIIYQPDITTPSLGTSGVGDLNPTFFLSPARGKLIWGAGPTFSLRTETNSALGNGKWGAGPAVVILVQPGKWTLGFLANNIWSFAGDKNHPSVNAFLLQYFVNYNLKKGWYLTSAPILTANWNAPSGNQWVIPFGGGFGRIFRVGKQPINARIGTFYNTVRPDQFAYPPWTVQFQIALLYPKPK